MINISMQGSVGTFSLARTVKELTTESAYSLTESKIPSILELVRQV